MIQSSLKEFALCIRVSSFFPARVTGLRAGKNVTIPDERSARSARSAHSARRRIDVKPSWKMLKKSSFLEANRSILIGLLKKRRLRSKQIAACL